MSGKRGERQDLTLPSRSALHERPKPFAVHLGSASRSRSFAALHPDPRLEPKLRGGSPWIPASAEAYAVLRWIAAEAEAFRSPPVGPLPGRSLSNCPVDRCLDRSLRSSPVGPLPGRSLSDYPVDRCLDRSLRSSPWIAVWIEIRPVLLRKDVLAEASSSLLLDSRRDRSLWQVSRIPAWAEALAVHRSVFRFRPKPWRFTCPESPFRPKPIGVFRPARMSAEAGILSGLAPRQSRSSGGLPPKRRASRSRSVSSVRIPVGAEALPVHLWRFREAEASGSTGLLDEPCRPCKSEGQARCVRMAAASSAALAVTSQTFTCDPIRSVSGCSLVLRPEGRSTRPQLEPVMGIRVVKADSACG